MTLRSLLGAAVLLASASLVLADGAKYWVYIGTGKSTSKGIYRAEFDSSNGTLSEPVLVAEVNSPTFLAIHPSQKYLYCVGETPAKKGGVHAYAIDAKTGDLKKLNDSDSGGAGPCHVMCDREGKCLLVANYAGGSIKCLTLNPDGSLGSESTFHQHAGSSINPNRQKEPHAHSTNVSPDNKFAVVADLGMDKLVVYKLDAAKGRIEPSGSFTAQPGCGPRHFAWHPNGKWAYTNGELDASVTAMKYDNGVFTQINIQPTLPKDTPKDVADKNSTAEIVVHPSGKYVFVSNRGHNSIATFKVNDDGSLTVHTHLTGGITIPRNFNIDPSGKWILVANQDGKSISMFEWDNATGTGKKTNTSIAIDRPMCIKFVERK